MLNLIVLWNHYPILLTIITDNIDISKPEIIEITFKDSYEIDNLIHILEKFKKECSEYIGEWR